MNPEPLFEGELVFLFSWKQMFPFRDPIWFPSQLLTLKNVYGVSLQSKLFILDCSEISLVHFSFSHLPPPQLGLGRQQKRKKNEKKGHAVIRFSICLPPWFLPGASALDTQSMTSRESDISYHYGSLMLGDSI